MKRPSSLTSSSDFRRVLHSGRVLRTAVGAVHFAPSAATEPRLGLVVSRRLGGAVRRNRIKRRLRAAFAIAWQAPGYDVVVRAKPASATLPFQELENSLRGPS